MGLARLTVLTALDDEHSGSREILEFCLQILSSTYASSLGANSG